MEVCAVSGYWLRIIIFDKGAKRDIYFSQSTDHR